MRRMVLLKNGVETGLSAWRPTPVRPELSPLQVSGKQQKAIAKTCYAAKGTAFDAGMPGTSEEVAPGTPVSSLMQCSHKHMLKPEAR